MFVRVLCVALLFDRWFWLQRGSPSRGASVGGSSRPSTKNKNDVLSQWSFFLLQLRLNVALSFFYVLTHNHIFDTRHVVFAETKKVSLLHLCQHLEHLSHMICAVLCGKLAKGRKHRLRSTRRHFVVHTIYYHTLLPHDDDVSYNVAAAVLLFLLFAMWCVRRFLSRAYHARCAFCANCFALRLCCSVFIFYGVMPQLFCSKRARKCDRNSREYLSP